MSDAGCCDEGVPARHIVEATTDATMVSCCEREREQQEKVPAYAQTLSGSDPTAVRRRIVAESVVRAPPPSLPAVEDDTESDLEDSGTDADDDRVLEMLRRQRLEELCGNSQPRSAVPQDEEVNEVCVLDELEDDVPAVLRARSKAGSKVLCALIQPGFARKDDLIECLQGASLACRVVACRLQPVSALPASMGWSEATTVVLLLKDDTVVASVEVMEEGWRDHDLAQSLEAVLLHAGGVDRCDKNSRADESDDDGPGPCATCGRRYLHTHINQ